MSHYDTTTLQTKTCGKIAKLIENVVDYLIEEKGDATKKRKVLMEMANYLRQYDEAIKSTYGGPMGISRYKRELKKNKTL
tara:strand:+ start:235 stop:474 length:240 start_codon:yes stop_codon:yes gene_type:complete